MLAFPTLLLAVATLAWSAVAHTGSPEDLHLLQARAVTSTEVINCKPDKHSNFGARCKKDKQCRSAVKNSAAVCLRGKCSFRCLGDTAKQGDFCVGSLHAPKCKTDRQCKPTKVKHAKSVCSAGHCTFACLKGWHVEGNSCVRDCESCGHKKCPKVENGWNVCKGKTCKPQCATYLGFTLYCNKRFPSRGYPYCRCINTQNDPMNCGIIGNQCVPGYTMTGTPICTKGKCGLDCHGAKLKWGGLNPYCTKTKGSRPWPQDAPFDHSAG